jgi:hypothetical protein
MSTAKKKDLNSLGDIYGNILNGVKNNILKESKVKQEIGEAPLQKGGPQETAGYMPTKVDRRKMSKKELDDNLYNIKDLSEEDEETAKKAKKSKKDYDKDGVVEAPEEEFKGSKDKAIKTALQKENNKETRKIARESLNKFMSKKSVFDKLYEQVMFGDESANDAQDLDALGLDDSTPDSELGSESEDEVTLTLDRETAMKLYDVLAACCGDTEGEGEMGEDEMGEETGGEDEFGGNNYDEDEETLGSTSSGASTFSKAIDYGKSNKVGNLKTVGGTASSASTDKVGNDGDHGHALVNAKQPNVGKNNKVGNLKTGQGAFQR